MNVTMPPDLCRCGHTLREHHHAKSCTAYSDAARLKFCKCEQFVLARSTADIGGISTEEGESTVMAKVKQGKKIVLFEVTSKNAEELLDKKNTTNAAIFYRILAAAEKPMQRLAIYEASKSKCESGAAWERLGNQTHDTLARLKKAGFVKRTETREEVKAKPAREKKPNGPPKAKRVRKPRQSKAAAKPNGSAVERDDFSDVSQNEATA